ncbi:uncharacterized protein ACRADG_001257 [Cochliomyia hominivorax]
MSTTHRQSIHSIHNKKFWTEFFYLYESLPALWDMNNPLYKNRQVKCDAYDIMVDKLREIEPKADREDVLRKINIFRTNYRRECSRINASLQEGRHYQSTLWYFDLLCFLQTTDSRRDRKRKLLDNNDGEKSIMRKRRANIIIQKSSDQFKVSPKKEQIIEYQPNPTHNYEYQLEEEPDFEYAHDELASALVDSKSDCTSEIQTNPLDINNCVEEDDDEEDDQSQTQEYHEHENEYQNYELQRNNKKIELTTDNVITTDTRLDITDESQEQQEFQEYNGENESMPTTHWSIKTTNTPNIQVQKQTGADSLSTLKLNDINDVTSTKFVRNVKTMTSRNSSLQCYGKLSESSEILAKSWAVQYDELKPDQKILARKAINDILFEGCMGHLAIGNNGRVIVNDGNGYANLKTINTNDTHEEVESGEIYEQATLTTTPNSSMPGLTTVTPTVVTVTANIGSNPKSNENEEWLKL